MAVRNRLALLLPLALLTACASASDRLNDGIALQAQGRYVEAVYRYAEAIEKDRSLTAAQDRLIAAGDSAVMVAMDGADDLERQGEPVRAAALYRQVDRMLTRVREVGMRLELPSDYSTIRRAIFDNAINWQMVRGDEAAQDGRWAEAREYYLGARGDYLPSRAQLDEAYDAETRVLLDWAAVELTDQRPRVAYGLAQEAVDVRESASRETVLAARELQEQALEAGTVVLAVAPVMAEAGVRQYLGGEFEIQLDNDLGLDHWSQPPLFVRMADPLILRRELRGLLRGQLAQSPTIVGRAADLIGADLAVMIRLAEIEVLEKDVRTDRHQTVITRSASVGTAPGRDVRRGEAVDTVTYRTLRGTLSYYVEADIVLVDTRGREITRFEASSTQTGPFQRGEFDGDPRMLDLPERDDPFFDPGVLAGQVSQIESAVLEDLAAAIAVGTFDQVLRRVR